MTGADDGSGWTVTPTDVALGASVTGADLTRLDEHGARQLRNLLHQHLVVAFADQQLTPDDHVRIGHLVGDPYIHPFLNSINGHPEVLAVIKEAEDEDTFGGEFWHADITFEFPPASISLLYAIDLPDRGGDTLFANQYLAFERLSSGMQEMLEGLHAVHVYPGMNEGDPHSTAVHPVVRVHPATGGKALYINPAFVQRFDGMTAEESAGLLDYLYQHQVRPEFMGRVRWAPNQLTMWDNRATLHFAVNDYPGQRRLLHRVTSIETD